MKKSRVTQTVLVAVLAVCTLFSCFITVLACIPVTTDIEVAEPVKAYAFRELAGDTDARIDVTGALKNTTDQPMTVERLEILLTDQQGEREGLFVVENLTLYPKHTLPLSYSQVMDGDYHTVKKITATVGGETVELRNTNQASLATAFIPMMITAVFAFFLVRVCKVRYYMLQEDRADRQERS